MKPSRFAVAARAALEDRGGWREEFGAAVARYARAEELREALSAEWESLGRPLLAAGGATGSALVPHPMVRMIQEAERDASRFAQALGIDPASLARIAPKKIGRPAGAVSADDRRAVASGPPKLRVAK